MSGYPDDRDDDRDDRDRDGGDDRRDDARAIRRAKSAVMVPAIGLIVTAAFGLLSVVYGIIQYPGLDAAFDEQVKQVENNPQIPANQKPDQIKLMNQIRDGVKVGYFPLYGTVGVVAVIILVGALKLMSLSSPGLVYFGAVLSFLPCVSGCCLLGLVFGIWALVAMGKPEVKAGFAAKRRAANSPDAY